ncbi:MAG: TraR/DksA C4-type zinc finger protein [Actinomycetota bacterium]
MPLTQQGLDAARQRLDDELKSIETELVDLGFPSDGEVEATFDEGFADAAHTTSERGKALALADELRHRKREALAATLRLDQGTYGICESCGNEVGDERLEALPAASLCITCKQKA